jgi:hypothetical protein
VILSLLHWALEAHVHKTTCGPVDLYGPVRNAFDGDKSIARASGRGLGPGNGDFLGPVKLP